MAASYPTAVKTFTTKNTDDTLQPADPNDLQDEVNAIEAGLLNGTARLNSSGSTLASVHVSGGSTFAGDVGCTGTIGTSAARVKTLWVGQLDASSIAGGLTACALRRLTSQVLSTGVDVAVIWLDELFDVGGLHSTVTNPSRINLVSSGYWTMLGGVMFEVGAGTVEQYAYWRLNGVSTSPLGPSAEAVGQVSAAHTGLVTFGAHYAASTADYVELIVFTKDVANLNAGPIVRGYPHALVQRIG